MADPDGTPVTVNTRYLAASVTKLSTWLLGMGEPGVGVLVVGAALGSAVAAGEP